MTVIQLASRARPVAAPAAPQVTTATVFQFPIKAKPAPRDKWDDCHWLTEEEKAECRANSAARFAKRAAEKRFGKRLHVVRAILGLSIEAAANAADVKPQSFKNYESGATSMRTARLIALANHPTVSLTEYLYDWLLEDGAPADKERDIIAYCRSVGAFKDDSRAIVAAICALNRPA